MSRQGRLSPAAVKRAAEDREAVRIRLMGATFQKIGATLGHTPSWAHKAVDRELRRAGQLTGLEELRALELERLDALTLLTNTKLEQADDEQALKIIDRLISISHRRARLTGMDGHVPKVQRDGNAPSTAPDPAPDLSILDTVAEYQALLEQLGTDGAALASA